MPRNKKSVIQDALQDTADYETLKQGGVRNGKSEKRGTVQL
jgi:hypothetical protein